VTRATLSAKIGPRQLIARVAGVHPSTITRWARGGLIPPEVAQRRPSGRWHYDVEAAAPWLAEWLTAKETRAPND